MPPHGEYFEGLLTVFVDRLVETMLVGLDFRPEWLPFYNSWSFTEKLDVRAKP